MLDSVYSPDSGAYLNCVCYRLLGLGAAAAHEAKAAAFGPLTSEEREER